ncbi:MAG: tetratricopeptide repeat protein [Pseudomonadota bacterium]|nr:tetratricopeptide repeat protein [Pseudomonadota bacterium]
MTGEKPPRKTYLFRHFFRICILTKQEWRLMYARMLANAQQFTQAIEQFQWLLPNYPDKADILYALGILSLQTEQLKTAKEYFKKLVHSEERLNTAYYYLGQIAETEDNLAQALSWYQKVDDGSNYLNAQARIALILVEQGQLDKALRHLHMVPVDNDEEALILTQFEAELLIEKQYYKRAMAVYNRALADEPDNVELLYMRALLAEKMGAITQLEQDLRRVLALEPDNVQALNALGYTLADHTQRYQEAYELIKQALSLRPNDYYILDSMGWVLYRMGHYAQAIKYLQKALEQQFDPEVSAHLGEILWNSGDREAAEAIWNKALEAFPDNPKLLEVIQRFLP